MSLHKMLRAAAGYQAPAPANTDPQFNYVSMLLHGDGTNGAQNNTFVDSSTNNFTIARNGNTTQGSLSPYGNLWSNYFDGNGDFLQTPTATALNFNSVDYTAEAWVYLNMSTYTSFDSGGRGIVSDYLVNINNGRWMLAVNPSGKLEATEQNVSGASSVAVTDSQNMPLQQWVHVAICKSGTTLYLFKNGTLVGSATSAVRTTFGGRINVGQFTVDTNYRGYFQGFISNVRLVKGTALYTSSFTPSTTPLTAVSGTSLLTCQSNRFIDNSANNFTITRNGDVRVTKESPFLPTAAYSTSTIGGSGYFDGTGDYLSINDALPCTFGSGDFTIEFWLYLSSTQTAILYDGRPVSGVGATPTIYLSSNVLYYFTNNANRITGSTLSNSTWTHVALCKGSGSTRLFVNGTQVGSTYADSVTYTNTAGRPLIGASGETVGQFPLSGYMSDVRIIKGTALYTSTFTPPTAPLTAITNTSLLLNFTNAGIFDNAAENDMETVGNAQISTSVKKYGTGSIAFDGTGDWLLVPDNTNLQLGSGAFTIEGWVNLALLGSPRGLASKGTSTTGWSLSVNSLNQVVFTDATTAITTTTALMANTWYHVAVVRSGTGTNQTVIYIDGVSSATGTSASNFNQTSVMYIGADRTGGSALNGYIDDLRITKGYARYTANFTPPTAAFPDQ